LLAHRWYPADAEPRVDLSADDLILRTALASPSTELRRAAVRALGRFEDPRRLPEIASFLADVNPANRQEAAHANGQAFRNSRNRGDVLRARAAIEAAMSWPVTPASQTAYETFARLHYDDAMAAQVEKRLTADFSPAAGLGPPADVSRATYALEAIVLLFRENPGRPVADRTIAQLRRLAKGGFRDKPTEPSAPALQALVVLNYRENAIALNAIAYRCPPPATDPACGAAIRRLGVQMLDPIDPTTPDGLRAATLDADYAPRLEAVRLEAARVSETKSCRLLIEALADKVIHVQVEALERLSPSCDERDEIIRWLKTSAIDVGPEPAFPRAALASRSLTQLIQFAPAEARALLPASMSPESNWQLRLAAANAAGLLGDEKAALTFVDDRDPIVRDEALRALVRLNSRSRVEKAVIALESADLQLVRTAAEALRNAADAEAVTAIVKTLIRLTAEGKDTSRETRLELFERLKEQAKPDARGLRPAAYWRSDIEKLLKDFDPEIASAAADTLALLDGTRPSPRPTRRPPQQPAPDELASMPRTVKVVFNTPGDDVELALKTAEAPLTVARFLSLARAGFYDNSVFYRLMPLKVLVGGSPAGHQFDGDARFLRDEISLLRHTEGMVGMMTHGRDTGNGQFFINLADGPAWNYDYTVFATVTGGRRGFLAMGGMQVLTSLLEGTRISRIEF
jgi:cyclophilin family peptidyl-prolyl cis-trans isomerase/HEAT repeat protein